jgi:hypothetical protein
MRGNTTALHPAIRVCAPVLCYGEHKHHWYAGPLDSWYAMYVFMLYGARSGKLSCLRERARFVSAPGLRLRPLCATARGTVSHSSLSDYTNTSICMVGSYPYVFWLAALITSVCCAMLVCVPAWIACARQFKQLAHKDATRQLQDDTT